MISDNKKSICETHPDIAKEWHHAKNGDLQPCDFTPGSNIKVWWVCENGHEWQARVHDRCIGKGCPYDSGLLAIPGLTDLTTTHPEIAKEFNKERNGDVSVEILKAGSGKLIWWICDQGHEWKSDVYSRTSRDTKCPYCTKKRPLAGATDFGTVYPLIAAELHPLKNGTLKASDLLPSSNKKVWWQCKRGHEWQTSVNHRTNKVNGTGCPYCNGKRPIAGETDFETLHPELAREWNYKRNNELKPSQVLSYSHKKVWWICPSGHEWKASVAKRVTGTGCPYDAKGGIMIRGVNDLATKYPNLIEEWNTEKNNAISPSDVSFGTLTKVWWKCKNGHEWKASVSSRARGSGCPICENRKVLVCKLL